jgi:hypothetical protein
VPHSSWSVGRNALYTEAQALQQEQGWQAEYLIFTDDDVEVYADNKTANSYSLLHAALTNVQPAVASVGFRHGPKSKRNLCARAPCAPDIDAAFNAFHATAAPMLLPYDTFFEDQAWSCSQAIIIELMIAAMPEHVVQFNHLYAINNEHRTYPKKASIFLKPKNGLSQVAQYVKSRVSMCLRDQIGLLPIGKGAKCHSCEKTRACDASDDCASVDGSLSEPINYMDVVKCKPHLL